MPRLPLYIPRIFLRGLLCFLFLSVSTVHAATGTIDATHKYAWSNVGGYVNFAPASSTVTVSDSVLTGYAWSANDGWINLAPSGGGVLNSTQGTLSGFAWDETEGWIDFQGVTIDSSGKFHGQAIGANETISFDCSSCDVETTWLPTATSTSTAPSTSTEDGSNLRGIGISGQSATPAISPTTATGATTTTTVTTFLSLSIRAVIINALNIASSILASIPQSSSSSTVVSESATSTQTASALTGLLQTIQGLLAMIARILYFQL